MANKIAQGYVCKICGFVFKEQKLSRKCAAHDKKYGACSIELEKQALGVVQNGKFVPFKRLSKGK